MVNLGEEITQLTYRVDKNEQAVDCTWDLMA